MDEGVRHPICCQQCGCDLDKDQHICRRCGHPVPVRLATDHLTR